MSNAAWGTPGHAERTPHDEQLENSRGLAKGRAGDIPVYCAFDAIVELADLRPNPKNPNQHPDSQIELLAKVIRAQGWRAPVTVSTRSGLIVRGHGRYMAAKIIGCPAPVDYQHYESEEAELADLVADNRLAELAEVDDALLAAIMAGLNDADYDTELTGYDAELTAALIAGLEGPSMDFDKADAIVPEAPEDPVSQPGDIWQLGPHRLVCGDSTDPATYTALMQEDAADLIVTDPPYNVDYEGTAGKIKNDSMTSEAFRAFLTAAFGAMAGAAKPGAGAYIFHADSEGVAFREAFQGAGFLLKQCLIWVKNAFVLGRQDYQWRHEPILYGWKEGAAHYFTEQRNLSTVIDESGRPDVDKMTFDELADLVSLIYDAVEDEPTTVLYCDKPLRNAEHPTMKPVALVARLIENSSRPGWVVLDPFGGSGSTLMACEGTGRAARLIELDPRFADVIVKRYAEVTGKRNIILHRGGSALTAQEAGII